MDLKCNVMTDWIELAQDGKNSLVLVKTAMNLRVP
jgi:hypothetical protein